MSESWCTEWKDNFKLYSKSFPVFSILKYKYLINYLIYCHLSDSVILWNYLKRCSNLQFYQVVDFKSSHFFVIKSKLLNPHETTFKVFICMSIVMYLHVIIKLSLCWKLWGIYKYFKRSVRTSKLCPTLFMLGKGYHYKMQFMILAFDKSLWIAPLLPD